jgi:hypothetical protein
MPKSRKTVEIEKLLDYANGYLASDYTNGGAPGDRQRRQGVIDMLEAALHAIGRYRGYVYLDETQITKSMPGIRWDAEDRSGRFTNTDNTRRRYA